MLYQLFYKQNAVRIKEEHIWGVAAFLMSNKSWGVNGSGPVKGK